MHAYEGVREVQAFLTEGLWPVFDKSLGEISNEEIKGLFGLSGIIRYGSKGSEGAAVPPPGRAPKLGFV